MLLPIIAADSVRRLSVAIVLLSNSFNKVLIPSEVERVHEEVAEFYAFYQEHGAAKVDFEFSLVTIDRPIARREIAEVSPGRYYLSRENLAAELTARGFRGRFDEVVALHAWSNANPDRALQAYGGGAVGPDGNFLGDAGYNSIPVMGRDPGTIGQVLIHEVLHNLDDMFSRSGMADSFLNSDEMSRNMAQLLRERPGAFLPLYTDSAMLAFADRERQGREGYPWRLQLVYYGWMLERTPKAAWDRLRYGRMVPREQRPVRPLYATIYTSVGNETTYVPVLAQDGARLTVAGRPLEQRRYEQTDFDGAPIYAGSFWAAWAPVTGTADTVLLPIARGRSAAGSVRVVRQRVGYVRAPTEVVTYLDGVRRQLVADARVERCCGDGPVVTAGGTTNIALTRGAADGPGEREYTASADIPGWHVHPALTRMTVRRSWSVRDDGPIIAPTGSPVTLNAFVREDRGRDDASVTARLGDRTLPLVLTGDGRYSVTVTDELPFGLHWVQLRATSGDGSEVVDSVRLLVRPGGWIRVPESFARAPDGTVEVTAQMTTRMGVALRQPLPLFAIVRDQAAPLLWRPADHAYRAAVQVPEGESTIVVTSLLGDPQRRVVRLASGPRTFPPSTGVVAHGDRIEAPPFAAAVRMRFAPTIDGDDSDWPETTAPSVRFGRQSFVLTDTSVYHGDRDLSGYVRFAWDDSTLYVAGEFSDDSVTSGDAWDVDRVNLVFDMADNTTPVTYESANPTLDQWQEDDYWVFWRSGGQTVRRFGKQNADPVPGARLATRRTRLGWTFEVAIPRAALPGYVPFTGQVAGLQVFVTDGDADRTATELMWTAQWPYSADGIEWRLAELAHLLFVDAPIR